MSEVSDNRAIGIQNSSFGLFDTNTWTYENIRSPYDMETAAGKILETTLPRRLGQRLFLGV